MAIIDYSRLGEPIADYLAERVAFQVQGGLDKDGRKRSGTHGRTDVYRTSSGLMMRAFQLLVAEGRVDPIDIAFRVEGQPVKHDRFGRLMDLPQHFSDVLHRFGLRMQNTIRQRLIGDVTEEQRLKFRELYQEWFQHNVYEILTAPVPASEENPKGTPGAKFIYAPDMQHLKHLDNPDAHPKFFVAGWAEAGGQPILVAVPEGGGTPTPIALGDVVKSAYDVYGDKIVVKAFNEKAAWDMVGADGSALASGDVSWEIAGRNPSQTV